MRAVRFDEYGGVDVRKVVDVPRPVPGAGQVLARVKAAGINPGEAKIRLGLVDSRWPTTFPSGDTIANFEAVPRYGVKAEGSAEGASASVLAELARLIAAGKLEVPIAAAFPLDRVQDAYRRLEMGHIRGKIVLLP